MFTYLQNEQVYINRYDLQTVEECLDQISMLRDVGQKMRVHLEGKKLPDEEIDRNTNLMAGRLIFFTKANRYKNRAATIGQWIERDHAKQDKQDNTLPPQIDCPDCGTSMIADDFKHLEDWPEDKPMRVLFFFNCTKCKKRLGAYDDGEIHKSQPELCPKCKKEITVKATRKGKVITWKRTCKACGYTKTEIDDLAKHDEEHQKWQEEQNKKEEEGKKLLEKYREEFCLSDKEGQEHIELLEAMEVAHEVYNETLGEIDNPAQEKLMTVSKTSITDLEKVLNKATTKKDFTQLAFGNPNIGRYVLVPFTLRDNNSKRHERESISALSDLLKATLKDTNWRAENISYRLGFMKGTLKGYESEDDLLKLFGKIEQKKPQPKLDPKLREKYQHHNYVQLAKMSAEFEAKERMRKRRLKDEPEGFFYERGESGYNCGICHRSQYSEDIWWREDGLRCRDCWSNIQEGVIPVLNLKQEWWDLEFLTKFDLTYYYGVHPSSIKKLRREGMLVGRDLKDSKGNLYETVYLVSENKEFLTSHPRKSEKSRSNETVSDGKGGTITL